MGSGPLNLEGNRGVLAKTPTQAFKPKGDMVGPYLFSYPLWSIPRGGALLPLDLGAWPCNSRVPKVEALPESLGREQSDCHLDTESMVCCRGGNHDFSKAFSSFTERKKEKISPFPKTCLHCTFLILHKSKTG